MRKEWIEKLTKMADPVLECFITGQMNMPLENKNRANVTYLEALGRLLLGMAPWLETEAIDPCEEAMRAEYAQKARKAIEMAVTPGSPIKCNFSKQMPDGSKNSQPLVDAAFLAEAIHRAPTQLWDMLSPQVKENVINAMKESATIQTYRSNWLLFAAQVQMFLLEKTGYGDLNVIDYAMYAFTKWYKGDGAYGDGEGFAFDFYNSYVIHPMLYDISMRVREYYNEYKPEVERLYNDECGRLSRYAAVLESLINADGTYAPLGRSITYRTGAFHALALAAWKEMLPSVLKPAQVRCALNAVINRALSDDAFDENGWLVVGLSGYQPALAEPYITTGSLYMASLAFLPLGLKEDHPFWSDPDMLYTQQKAWNGINEKIKC